MDIQDLPTQLYHGTSYNNLNDLKDVNKIDPNHASAKKYVDNGPGFYLTKFIKQAASQANNVAYKYNNRVKRANQKMSNPSERKNPTIELVLEYEFDKEKFIYLNGKSLILPEENHEWSRFILNNRLEDETLITGLHNRDQKYDIVYSALADGRTANEIIFFQEEEDKSTAFETFHHEISKQYFSFGPADQLSLHNKKIIKECLTYKRHLSGNALDTFK